MVVVNPTWEPVLINSQKKLQFHCPRCDWKGERAFPTEEGAFVRLCDEATDHLLTHLGKGGNELHTQASPSEGG